MALIDYIPKYFKKQSTPINVINVQSPNFGEYSASALPTGNRLIEDFTTIPDLFLITNFLAKRVAKVPVKVVKPSGRLSPNSELWKLIEKPNFYQSWQQLIMTAYAYYNILGNNYMYGIEALGFGQITSLFNLPAEMVSVYLMRNNDLPNWLNEVESYKVNISGTTYTLDKEKVLHNKSINLLYDSGQWVYGISKYIPGAKVNRELKAIYDSKTSIIEHRGAMGIITNKSDIPDVDESVKVKERLKEKFGIGSHQDKFIVTTQDLSWQQMNISVKELQLIENAKYSFEKLCQLSEFDPVILSTEGSTYSNKEQAYKDLYKNVIKGDVDTLYNSINGWLSPMYGGDMIVPDWDKVQELEADKAIFTDMLTKQIESAIITPYKAAQILYGDEVDESNPPPDEYFKKGITPIEEEQPLEPIVSPELIPETDAE